MTSEREIEELHNKVSNLSSNVLISMIDQALTGNHNPKLILILKNYLYGALRREKKKYEA